MDVLTLPLSTGVGSEINQRISGQGRPPSTSGQNDSNLQASTGIGAQATPQNRYGSFASQRSGNDAKWYVDGCGYMWAVSVAIEQARESIWILDCKSLSVYQAQQLGHVRGLSC